MLTYAALAYTDYSLLRRGILGKQKSKISKTQNKLFKKRFKCSNFNLPEFYIFVLVL